MSDTYSATLRDGDTDERVELESIAGAPQKSFTRSVEIDGQPTEQLWELDADSGEGDPVYRPGGFPEHDYS